MQLSESQKTEWNVMLQREYILDQGPIRVYREEKTVGENQYNRIKKKRGRKWL